MEWRNPFARSRKKIIPEIPQAERAFSVVRSQSKDFYAVGKLAQFENKKLGVYHALNCTSLTRSETSGDRSYDRSIVSQVLSLTSGENDRRFWSRILFGTGSESGITITHRLAIQYILPSGGNRSLLDWGFDFGILVGLPREPGDPIMTAAFIAGRVCEAIVFMLRDCEPDMLLPGKPSRRFWHTVVYRAMRSYVVPKDATEKEEQEAMDRLMILLNEEKTVRHPFL